MKKILLLTLALNSAMLFPSCGNSTDSSSKASEPVSSQSIAVEITEPITEVSEEKTHATESDITLRQISNWTIDDIWNKGFCDIYHYVENGKNSTGKDMDIEFTVDNLKIAYNKKDAYNKYILSLDDSIEEQAQLINTWNKMSEQIDILYEKVITETPRPADETYEFKYDLFKQYFDTFYPLCLKIKDPVFKSELNDIPNETENSQLTEQTTEPPKTNAINGIDVDEGLFNVTITIPAEFIQDPDATIAKASEEDGVKSCTVNEDGSITYVMTKKAHSNLIAEFKTTIDNDIDTIIQSGRYPSITDITHNDEFTDFTMYVTDYETYKNSYDGIVKLSLALYTGLYQSLKGEPVDSQDTKLHIIDNSTGEEVETS